MKPDQITAELSEHLRGRGVEYDPKALEAFAAQVRREHDEGAGAETLLDRFMEARNDYARAIRKAFYAGHALGFGMLLSILSLAPLGFGSLGVLLLLQGEPLPKVSVFLVALVFGVGLGGTGLYRAAASARTLIRARREAEEAFARRRVV